MVAAESLEQLQRLEQSRTTLSQLVLAYAKFDLKKAMEVSKKLPAFSSGSVDVDTLETASWAMGAKIRKTPRPGGEKTPKTGNLGTPDLLRRKRNPRRRNVFPRTTIRTQI